MTLIFDHVVSTESLPASKFVHGGYMSRSSSVFSNINHSINNARYVHYTPSFQHNYFILFFVCVINSIDQVNGRVDVFRKVKDERYINQS